MELSQEDYEARKQRVNDAIASDEDRRLVKEYERHGFEETRLTEDRARRELVPADQITGRALLPAETDGVGRTLPPAEEHEGEELEDPGLVRPASSANKPEWVAFAEQVNQRRAEDDRPIENPADPKVTKEQLIDAYGQFGEPAD